MKQRTLENIMEINNSNIVIVKTEYDSDKNEVKYFDNLDFKTEIKLLEECILQEHNYSNFVFNEEFEESDTYSDTDFNIEIDIKIEENVFLEHNYCNFINIEELDKQIVKKEEPDMEITEFMLHSSDIECQEGVNEENWEICNIINTESKDIYDDTFNEEQHFHNDEEFSENSDIQKIEIM